MSTSGDVPTLTEFQETTKQAFAFLQRFGFAETAAPSHRSHDPFQVWFRAGRRFVVVQGEGYGSMASVTLETVDGLELAEIYLVPPEARPDGSKRSRTPVGQLEQIHEAARRLERYGADFLSGDEGRFVELAKLLPPYKRPLGRASD